MSKTHVIFDMDGVLIDSLPAAKNAYEEVLRAYGAQPTDEEFNKLNGPTLDEISKYLVERHELETTPEHLLKEYKERFTKQYTEVEALGGSKELLSELTNHGVRLSLASSAPRDLINQVLEAHGLQGVFSNVVSGEDVSRGKPHPDIFLQVKQEYPNDTYYVIEDSTAGVHAAKSAGMQAIHLTKEEPAASALHARELQDVQELVLG